MEEDVRWIQRLANYRRAVVNLGEAAASGGGSELNRLEKQGLVKGLNWLMSWPGSRLRIFMNARG